MKLVAAVAVLAALGRAIVGAAGDNVDVVSIIAAYGVAAPFAWIAWQGWQRAEKRAAAAEAKNEDLNHQLVERAERYAPLLEKAAWLYQMGNERLTAGLNQTPPPPAVDMHTIEVSLHELLRRMREGEADAGTT